MYRLIALDMDGTVLNPSHEISPRNKQAIAQARDKGIYVVLASGRPPEGLANYLAELNMNTERDFVLPYNGGQVKHIQTGNIIRSYALSGEDAKALAGLARDLNLNIHAFSEQHGLITPNSNQYTDLEGRINGLEIKVMPFDALSDDDVIQKVMFVDDESILSPAIEELPAELYEQFTVVRSAPFFLEILNKQTNKGLGVAALAEYLGIAQEEVICIGDAGNDAHMIEYAGLGIAMSNGSEEIKQLADYITASNAEDGVALAIEKFTLNHV
ncbi:sugar-phosphatase [Thaumasiovibrio sp. DFM-14]|uniref:sugar-phosphatase n=1 Tax=Thaumasiovibrio sp. DFM-14 TaxID=3384792 RepID=UPI00399EFC34